MSKNILIINNEKYIDEIGWIPQIKKAISGIETDVNFTIKHYSEISQEVIEEIAPDYMILTGRIGHHWDMAEINENYIPNLKAIKKVNIPTFGICAGMQLISILFGSTIGSMVDGEETVLEEGYVEHDVKIENDIFKGLGQTFYCRQFHRDEVKDLPDDFELMASSDMCKIQAIKHNQRPIYGVQFHPEWYTDEYPDGKIMLENFFKTKTK